MVIRNDVANRLQIANQFQVEGPLTAIQPFGAGNINDSYLVTSAAGERQYLLQRINQHVFPRPDWVMANLRLLQGHMAQQLAMLGDGRPWALPEVMCTPAGADHVYDDAGEFWRLQHFVEGSRSYAEVRDVHHAAEAGAAIGRFHRLIADLDPAHLHDTLVGFHVTPRYLADYQRHLAAWPQNAPSAEEQFCLDFIAARQHRVGLLEEALARGELHLRPIHGDPKVDNILIDTATDQAIAVIDLDTAKPGLIHYDIGDMLRSGCNPLGELTPDWHKVRFEVDLCETMLGAYCGEAAPILTEGDYAYMADAIWLLTFEMGLRFFSDYLNGNVYFNVEPAINLRRALVQMQLTASIEAQWVAIEGIVKGLADRVG
ncbi:MAG: aminoglycoside phosphotransferase family protein [Anaerolineales bacterium]|nr:aminoglycoside phosphotransferase family protein [Anaerolineales bacterium]